MAKARPRATRVAVPRWRSGGFSRNPTTLMMGSTSQPVSRSRTTEREGARRLAGLLRQPAHAQDVAADRGGQHVRDELAGEVVGQAGGAGRRGGPGRRGPSASAGPTGPARASVRPAATASQRTLCSVRSGMTSEASNFGTRHTRMPSMRRLRPTRRRRDVRCLLVIRCHLLPAVDSVPARPAPAPGLGTVTPVSTQTRTIVGADGPLELADRRGRRRRPPPGARPRLHRGQGGLHRLARAAGGPRLARGDPGPARPRREPQAQPRRRLLLRRVRRGPPRPARRAGLGQRGGPGPLDGRDGPADRRPAGPRALRAPWCSWTPPTGP